MLPPVTTSLTTPKVEAIPLSALPKDTTSELAGLSSHQGCGSGITLKKEGRG